MRVNTKPVTEQFSLKGWFHSVCRRQHKSEKTERTYWEWVKRFSTFHKRRPLREMGMPEVREFLNWLAIECHVSASTQNQALHSLLFLYKQVFEIDLSCLLPF